jgi:hypothetical protein
MGALFQYGGAVGMTDSGFTVGRSLALLFGSALVGGSFFVSAYMSSALQCCLVPPPLWLAFGVPIGFVVAGASLIAFAMSALTIRPSTVPLSIPSNPKVSVTQSVLGLSLTFLVILGCGLAVTGLIISSAFFYGCGSAGSCTEVPIRGDVLQAAANLCIVGVALLVVSVVPLGLLYLRRRALVPHATSA